MREKNQVVLPLDLGICIPEGDFVFKVAEICESLDYTELFNTYLRSWRKVNPITIFELIVYGYMKHVFRKRYCRSLQNGYTISTKYYSNDKCGRCPHRDKCHKSKNDYRTIQVNNVILEHRPKTLEALTSEEGTLLRMKDLFRSKVYLVYSKKTMVSGVFLHAERRT